MSPAGGQRPLIDPAIPLWFRRRRITDAMAELCVEEGYRAATIAKVVGRAGVSRTTVYEHFGNREEIFLASLDQSVDELLQRTEEACQDARSQERPPLEAGLGAILGWVAEEPAAAWVSLVEAFCATSSSIQRYLDALARFADLLGGVLPTEVPRPKVIEESLVGGVASILNGLLRAGEAYRAPEMLPELVTFVRAPFLKVP